MTSSLQQRREAARSPRAPRHTFDLPRLKGGVVNGYPLGYLTQLARPLTSRRPGERVGKQRPGPRSPATG